MDDNDLIRYDHIQGTHVNCCLRNYFNTYDIISQELCQAEKDIVTLRYCKIYFKMFFKILVGKIRRLKTWSLEILLSFSNQCLNN